MTTKPETNRQARVEQRRRHEQARERRRKIMISGGIAVVVAGAATGIALAATSGGDGGSPGGAGSETVAIAGVASYPDLKNDHVTTAVDYPQSPPAGGPHNAVWLNCGSYPAAVPNENAVHALEHGAVWITYRPGLADAQLATLKMLAGGSYLVLSPYQDMSSPITVTAWGKQLPVASADDPRIAQFIAEYKLSQDAPEPGAACSGGTGNPES